MRGMYEPLYFSLKRTARSGEADVALGDICSISGAPGGALAAVRIPAGEPVTRVTALWTAETLRALYPGRLPLSVGAAECLVYRRDKQPSRAATALKSALLATVMFFGGAVAIMTFHEDVDMPAVLGDICAFFTGGPKEASAIVSIPYSLGIVAGFAILLGLVRRRRHKPTLLELSAHEQDKAVEEYLADRDDG